MIYNSLNIDSDMDSDIHSDIEKNVFNLATLFPNGERQLSFYLNKPNRHGWGVVYLRLKIGSRVLRLSTNIRVLSGCWNKEEGRVVIPNNIGKLDMALLHNADKLLTEVKDFVFQNFFCNFASLGDWQEDKLFKEIKNLFIKMFKTNKNMKRNRSQSIIYLLQRQVFERGNPKTVKSFTVYVNNFKKFLNKSNIEDSVDSITTSTMRKYSVWLRYESGLSMITASHTLSYILKFLGEVERREDLDFNIDKSKLEELKETRSKEEKRKNSIALTEEEVKRIKEAPLTDEDLKIARDIFLLQCYCGFRFEDLTRFLDSKNFQIEAGIFYSVFETDKKDIISHTPLNHPKYYPQAYELYERYKDNSPYTDLGSANSRYNRAIRKIARLVNLNREITHTTDKGGKTDKKTVIVYNKISSHCGRHTFVTNCVRCKGIPRDVIMNITGHVDTKMIDDVYLNMTDEDKRKVVHNVGKKIDKGEIVANASCNYGIDEVREAKSVLTYLGVEYGDSMNFEELVNLIKDRQYWIADNCGVSVKILKEIYNISLPIKKRVRALKSLLGELMTEE